MTSALSLEDFIIVLGASLKLIPVGCLPVFCRTGDLWAIPRSIHSMRQRPIVHLTLGKQRQKGQPSCSQVVSLPSRLLGAGFHLVL